MRSKIYLEDAVPNSQRRTSGAKEYYPALVYSRGGYGPTPALFTAKAITEAMDRAEKQPEDAPSAELTLLQKLYLKVAGLFL